MIKRLMVLLVVMGLASGPALSFASESQSPSQSPSQAPPATYRFTDHWPAIPLYNQDRTPGCVPFSTATALSALVEAYPRMRTLPAPRFDARALYRVFAPKMNRALYNEDVLNYLRGHAIADNTGHLWHVGTWHYVRRAHVEQALLRYHVLLADILLSGRFDNQRNPITVPPRGWQQKLMAGNLHSVTVIGYNPTGVIIQNTYGNLPHHHHSKWVLTWHYWRKYAPTVYAFTIAPGIPATTSLV